MSPDTKITLALTHFNRFGFLIESFARVLDDPRISEIVIVDDASTDGSWEHLQESFSKHDPKVKLFRNAKNVDCYRNKKIAVELASNPWVILFDSDNIITSAYVDTLYGREAWDPRVSYAPEFAEPHFDYREFSGFIYDRRNIAQTIAERPKILTALNTANYFVNRNTYLRVWDGEVNPHTADSIYQNYNWLQWSNFFYVTPGLRYFHRVHDQSHYKLNVKKTGIFAKVVEAKLRALR